jgi:succinate-semialdehyde dehydrogenase/glutarate-semialdehyde dehydrogenase
MKLKRQDLFIERCFIDGEWISSQDKIEVKNPFNNEIIANVASIDAQQIEYSVKAASKAFSSWSMTEVKTRSKILEKWYDLIIENIDDLAQILTLEQGKPLEDAKKEIIYGANFVKWFSGESKKIQGFIPHLSSGNSKIFIEYEPLGVVAAITTWNFPSAMITRKIAPALAAGCSVILKPSELTPLSALALAKLAEEAGVPKGVLNVIVGDANEIGVKLCQSLHIKKLSFTGSTNIGKLLYSQCALTLKKLSLELGGNAPFIVFDDADIDSAVQGLLNSKIRSSGQACTAANRIFLHKSIKAKFLKRFIFEFSKLKTGNGFDPEVAIGPLINKASIEKIERLLTDAQSKGANILLGGKSVAGTLFFLPTIIDNCSSNMNIFKEEIFGPVVAIYDFDSEDQLIQMANDTEYGLAAYFYTENHSKVWHIAQKLDYGMVGINESLISNEFGAFGGRKHSGFGVEGSSLGIYEYFNTKYIYDRFK